MSSKYTIKDIARMLNVSPSTVSRALKDHPDISTKTKEAIKKLAKELKYKPNEIALSLKHSRTNVIGVMVPQLVHHFFSSVISGIEDIAYENNFHVMIYQSNESYDREVMNARAIIAGRVDGVIVSLTKETEDIEHFKNIKEDDMPMVFFDRICPSLETDYVAIDDYRAAYDAVQYLINTGAKKIVHFAGPENLEIGRQRKRGYVDALRANNIEVDESLIYSCDKHIDAKRITQQIIDSGNIPDAIFAVNDLTAVGAILTLRKNNVPIPDKTSVIGFTNGLISTISDPSLTTIEQHGYIMGQRAADILITRIKEGKFTSPEPIQEIIKTELIIRESTKKI